MMKRIAMLVMLVLGICMPMSAQQIFKGHFLNDENKIQMELNLYNDSIPVPGIEDETCYGYLRGNLNGTWVILKVITLEEAKAVFRASCDNGSDSQNVELTVNKDGKLEMKQLNDALIKTIDGKKYVKLPKSVIFYK